MRRVGSFLKRSFAGGILVLIPIVVTFEIVRVLFEFFDSLLGPAADSIARRHIPGLGLVAALVVVVGVGAIASNIVGKKILASVGRILENIPLVKTVYSASRQMVSALSPAGRGLTRAVLVEFPRKGIYSVGFVTARIRAPEPGSTSEWVSVLIPAALNPTSGWVVIVRTEDLRDAGFSVEEGVRLVVSGGFAAPEDMKVKAEKA